MSLVVIEGVVDSDVCKRDARHEVEWTDRLAALVRNGLVRVISRTPEPEPAPEPVKRKRRRGDLIGSVVASTNTTVEKTEDGGVVRTRITVEEPPADETDGE